LVFHGDHNSHLKIAKQNVHEHFDKSATENFLCRPTPHVWQALLRQTCCNDGAIWGKNTTGGAHEAALWSCCLKLCRQLPQKHLILCLTNKDKCSITEREQKIEMQTADKSLAKKYLFLTRTRQTLSGTTMQKFQHRTERFKRQKMLQGFKENPNSQQENLLAD
jgi:hypothetical protein